MNIYLTGYRCTGKTTVGERLGKLLGWQTVDADRMLVETAGISIADIVANQGWDAFREMEKAVITRIGRLDRHVVATGGGAVLIPDNVACMKATGLVIWLKARPETIHDRLASDDKTSGQRPSLTESGLFAEIEDVLRFRTPLYESAMDVYIDTDGKDVTEICQIIIKELKCREIQQGPPSG